MIEARLKELGLELPAPVRRPPVHLPFTFVNVRGDRALISGHPRHDASGAITGPFGQLGKELTTAEGYEAAKGIALSVLANLKDEIGSLDRITGWTRVFGMVNSAPGYSEQHLVINGASNLIAEVLGEAGKHARAAVGMACLPLNAAVEIDAVIEIR